MAYDIYGESLRKGHCEVHPHVHEEYPCSLCYAEGKRTDHYAAQQQREYYAEMQKHYEDEWMKDNSWQYRILTKLQSLLNRVIDYKRTKLLKRCHV